MCLYKCICGLDVMVYMYMYIYRTLHICMYKACTRALTKKHVLSPCVSHTLACTNTNIPRHHNMLLMYHIYTHTHTQNIHTRKCTHIHTRDVRFRNDVEKI